MKKIEKRAVFCLLLAGMLMLGLVVFSVKFFVNGGQWASFPANRHLYTNGVMTAGDPRWPAGVQREQRHPQRHPPRGGRQRRPHRYRGSEPFCQQAFRV